MNSGSLLSSLVGRRSIPRLASTTTRPSTSQHFSHTAQKRIASWPARAAQTRAQSRRMEAIPLSASQPLATHVRQIHTARRPSRALENQPSRFTSSTTLRLVRYYSAKPPQESSSRQPSTSDVQDGKHAAQASQPKKVDGHGKGPVTESSTDASNESITSSMSKYLHLPQLPHRPTKEELLAAATGFWSRMKVRFKWMSIRDMRPWNADEWGAFVSWFMLGHLVWILVGTTTFFSLVILSINTVFAQGQSTSSKHFTVANIYRNPGKVDRRLPDPVRWRDRCLRVRHRPEVGRRRDCLSQRLRFEATWSSGVLGQQGLLWCRCFGCR